MLIEAVRRSWAGRPIGGLPVLRLFSKCLAQPPDISRNQHGKSAARVRVDLFLIRESQHERLGPKRFCQLPVQPAHNPPFAEQVVHKEKAAGPEVAAHVRKGLARKQKALQAKIAVTAVQHQRVHQGVDDQVVLPIAGPQKVAAVVQVRRDA